jgi:threonine/homoserine/homoserine lactone efflux protein
MDNIVLIGTIWTIHTFSWLTPGPSFVLIVGNSLRYSRRTALWTSVGLAAGNLTHIAYSVTGLSLIVARSPLLFSIIKYLGVSYLIYMGVKTCFAKLQMQSIDTTKQHDDIKPSAAAKMGFLVNTLNPYASLFFASIFASVFAAHAPWWVIVTLILLMPLNTFFMSSLLAFLFSRNKMKSVYQQYESLVNKILGIAMIALAIGIAIRS